VRKSLGARRGAACRSLLQFHAHSYPQKLWTNTITRKHTKISLTEAVLFYFPAKCGGNGTANAKFAGEAVDLMALSA
jgi:hypothetical protein